MLRGFLKALFRLLFRVEVSGDVSPFSAKRLLIVANHESFLDGLVLGLFLPVRPTFVVHTGVAQQWFFRLILSQVDYLAVDPMNPMAMKKVIHLIEAGKPVMIFPEGRITVTGSLMKVYDGPAFVAAKTGATIVPVRLDGLARTYFSRLSGVHRRVLFPRIRIAIQPPRQIVTVAEGSARLRRRLAGERMREIMQDMLFASQPEQTLFDALIDAVGRFGRRARILEDVRQNEASYGEILRHSLALGRLLARETQADHPVGVLLPNVNAAVAVFFGLQANRRIPAMLNYTAGADAMQSGCTTARVDTVVTSKAFIEKAKLAAQIDALRVRVIFLEDLKARFGWLDRIWLIAWAQFFPRAAMHKSDPSAPAVILFTSGSEGKPKAVVHSHRSILANIAQIKAVIDFSPADKFLNALPIFHAFGLTCGTLLPVLTGTRLFLYPSPLHYRVIPEIVYDRGCSVLFGTSTFLGNYARFAHPYDFYRLRYVVAGAEKLNDSVRAAWMEKFGVRILEGYGATECAPVLSVNTPMAYKPGSVGTFLPGIEARLEPVDQIGEGGLLHVRGPNLMLGYYLHDNPGVLMAPASTQGAGWYATGDIVAIDAHGFVTIKGRVKRFAKLAGEMVSLEVVEIIANAAAPEAMHASSTRVDPNRGEALVLFTTAPGLQRDSLLRAARELGHTEIAVPREIIHIRQLPMLGTGKVDYVTLKRMAAEVREQASA